LGGGTKDRQGRGQLETKGRKWEGTEEKDLAMSQWCKRIAERIGKPWRFKRINQVDFNRQKPTKLSDFVEEKDRLL
jgi:hypothetical protein